MTCHDFREAAWGWALAALEPDESAECERHLLDECREGCCRKTLDEAKAVVLALADGVRPVRAPAVLFA